MTLKFQHLLKQRPEREREREREEEREWGEVEK